MKAPCSHLRCLRLCSTIPHVMSSSLVPTVLVIGTLLSGCASDKERVAAPPVLPSPSQVVPTAPAPVGAVVDAADPKPHGEVDAAKHETLDPPLRAAAAKSNRAQQPDVVSAPDVRPEAHAIAETMLLAELKKERANAGAATSGTTAKNDKDFQPVCAEPVTRGTVLFGAVKRIGGEGQFDDKAVVGELKKRLRAFQICYEQKLRMEPTLQGSVVAELTVAATGVVSSATAAAGADSRLAACVVETVKRFRFQPLPRTAA